MPGRLRRLCGLVFVTEGRHCFFHQLYRFRLYKGAVVDDTGHGGGGHPGLVGNI